MNLPNRCWGYAEVALLYFLAGYQEYAHYIVFGSFVYAIGAASVLFYICSREKTLPALKLRDFLQILACHIAFLLLEAGRYVWDERHPTHFPFHLSQVTLIILLSGTGTFCSRMLPPKIMGIREQPKHQPTPVA